MVGLTYVVVLRGSSAARFKPDGRLAIPEFPSATGPVAVIFRTRYRDEGLSVPVPRELWADVRGSAPSLDLATEAFASAARMLTSFVALGANARVDDPEVELAYDDTPGHTEHDYFQNFLPEEQGMPLQARWVNAGPTGALIKAVALHPESDRLHRAISQYSIALQNWSPGRDILALAHLYMGMEALTEVAIQEECRRRGLDKEQMARALGLEKVGDIGPHFRREVLFQKDNECYQKAKDASDGLEHGYKGFPEIRTLARAARDRSAAYLRAAIIRMSGIDEKNTHVLLNPLSVPALPALARGPQARLAAAH